MKIVSNQCRVYLLARWIENSLTILAHVAQVRPFNKMRIVSFPNRRARHDDTNTTFSRDLTSDRWIEFVALVEDLQIPSKRMSAFENS